ncbi:hypothetical protein HK104_007129, partial [Borealophlyctis nickersoniae]
EWDDMGGVTGGKQHSNSTVANTGSCCVPTIRKRLNPTAANEKSKKEPKNESETETELELEFDVEKEWDDMGGVTGGKQHSNSTVANTGSCRVQ